MDHARSTRAAAPVTADAHIDPVWDMTLLLTEMGIGGPHRDGDADRRAWAADYEEIE